MAKKAQAQIINIGGQVPTNGAQETIDLSEPYVVEMTLQGSSDMLFHRWNVEGVEAKAKAAKGSAAKKTDNIESYVYRDSRGFICIPGEYLRQTTIHAAKFRQDPRSPRKSAMDLFKAGIVSLTELASMGVKKWDYEDRRRVVVQRSAVTRTRPAFKAGWKADFVMAVNLPEYISGDLLHEVVALGGRLVGLADMRPTYGRYQITSWKVRSA